MQSNKAGGQKDKEIIKKTKREARNTVRYARISTFA